MVTTEFTEEKKSGTQEQASKEGRFTELRGTLRATAMGVARTGSEVRDKGSGKSDSLLLRVAGVFSPLQTIWQIIKRQSHAEDGRVTPPERFKQLLGEFKLRFNLEEIFTAEFAESAEERQAGNHVQYTA